MTERLQIVGKLQVNLISASSIVIHGDRTKPTARCGGKPVLTPRAALVRNPEKQKQWILCFWTRLSQLTLTRQCLLASILGGNYALNASWPLKLQPIPVCPGLKDHSGYETLTANPGDILSKRDKLLTLPMCQKSSFLQFVSLEQAGTEKQLEFRVIPKQKFGFVFLVNTKRQH